MLSSEVCFALSALAIAPSNLILKITTLRTEHRVENEFQIVAGSWIAVQKQSAGVFEDALEFRDTKRHADEIRQQTSFPENRMEAFCQLD